MHLRTGRLRAPAVILATLLIGTVLPACSGDGAELSNEDSGSAAANPLPERFDVSVTVATDGLEDPPTHVRMGATDRVPLVSSTAVTSKTELATGLVTAETADGQIRLAAIVPADTDVVGALTEVVIDTETTAASLAFRVPGLPTGEPVADLMVLGCIYSDPTLPFATTAVQRLLDSGGDPVSAPNTQLITAVNALVANLANGSCGTGVENSQLRGPTHFAATQTGVSCLKDGLIDPDGFGRNAVCGKLAGGTSAARKKATSGKSFEIEFKNPTPRWVAIEDPTRDGIERIVGFVEPKRWAIPGLGEMIERFTIEMAKALANYTCNKVSLGWLCKDGTTFEEAWKKVSQKVTKALADGETSLEMPSTAWGHPLTAVTFGSGENGPDVATAVGGGDPGPGVTVGLTLLTEMVLPAAGLIGDLKLSNPRKNVRKSLSKAFEEALAGQVGNPDSTQKKRERGKNLTFDFMADLAGAMGPAVSGFILATHNDARDDLDPLEMISATAALVKPFFEAVVDLLASVSWENAQAAFNLDAILDPAGLVKDVVVSTLKKLVPGWGWVQLFDTGVDIVNLLGSAGELMIDMGSRSSADLFWIGERSAELPLPDPVTEEELRAITFPLEGCSQYGTDLFADLSLISIDSTAIGDLDGDGVDDGALTMHCEFGGTFIPYEVYALRAADRVPVQIPVGVGVDSSWEFDVYAAEIEGGQLKLNVGASLESDAHCCPSRDVTETFAWGADAFTRIDLNIVEPETMTRRTEEALNSGDDSALDSLADPDIRNQLVELRNYYGRTTTGGSACSPDAFVSGVACLISFEVGWIISVTWERRGWQQFRIVGIEEIGGGQ